MSLLLGALGGLGAGLSGVAENRIQNIDQQSLAQMQQQMEIAKERRVEEMQKRQEQRGEESTIRAEGRALSNADLARQAQLNFETNPENVQKRTAAEISQLQAKDDYRYSNQAREAAYQGAMSEAKYGPMYEARAANATARVASGKMDKATELQYKRLLVRADAARKAAENATDEVKQLEYMDQAMKFEQAAQDMLASGGTALPGETRPTNANPLGLNLGALREDPEEKARLIQQLKDLGATLDFKQEPDTATLKAMLADMQQGGKSKVDAALGTDYGYGKRADGSNKGKGFLGELKRPDGDVSTEISVGVNIGGREMEIPTLVPTLTKQEVSRLLAGGDPTEAIIQKAVDHARMRIGQGKSPFAQPGEENSRSGGGILGMSRARILEEIDKMTNGNFDIPQDASTPELAKMLQQLRKDASEQSKRDAKQKAAEDDKAKSRAEKEAKDMKRMEGLLNYKPKYFGQRDSGM